MILYRLTGFTKAKNGETVSYRLITTHCVGASKMMDHLKILNDYNADFSLDDSDNLQIYRKNIIIIVNLLDVHAFMVHRNDKMLPE
jgi:hypothetical protein